MEKLSLLKVISEIYSKNENIISYLKSIDNRKNNSIEDILISYDFQAGSYTEWYKNDPHLRDETVSYLSEVINKIGEYSTILEVGVGEATILGLLIQKLNKKPERSYGFDISWSRIKYAQKFIKELKLENVNLFTGDLFTAPLKDNSVDIVYTSQAIEPNGGREEEALKELFRITRKYLILLEPAYELADEKAKVRMKEHGYITKLHTTAKKLGYKIIEYRLFEVNYNPLNPVAIMIIEKNSNEMIDDPMCCPITNTNFILSDTAYYSPESMLLYPIVNNIPCLLPQNAIVATKFLE
ncbi:class I SAM-dependent methyltransferase [Sporosarcina sp. PTS2304]|uniref:class I SAM-dependent methyltransferase n=1 Tax=Sporosarcina sp. PTS2304 TaxID=2283194 RepID=UPI000E0CDBDE|nr:class I SAM-dependent methyltransferase [Sporosarcina sp. PTS2304]AXH98433.1 class I SAM-dependent methyltransferase [Sporosarcina sp. PTS2304]